MKLHSENSILLDTLNDLPTDRPPFWFMRQAGRVLPSYNKLKEKYTFWQLMKDPKLAAEVTLLPIKDLEVDAAILFSDILVIPYAMGMGLDFTDKGPVFNTPLHTLSDPLKVLNPDTLRLEYIYKAIDEIVRQKPKNKPLIGFCGAPLTVLLYMLQGLSRKSEFPDAFRYIYRNKQVIRSLIELITELSIEYAQNQIKHGVEVFQLFETHAGLIPFELYNDLFIPSVRKIAKSIKMLNVPFIFFPKGIGLGLNHFTPDDCDYLGIDWQTPLPMARKLVDTSIGLQGNIDPRLLYSSTETMQTELEKLIQFGSQNTNWILNLGHGFLPDTPYESAKYLAKWVKTVNWRR